MVVQFSPLANAVYDSGCVSTCVFNTDSGRSSSSSKGERLSAKMRSLPGSNEPYEASSPKELGEESVPPSNSGKNYDSFCMSCTVSLKTLVYLVGDDTII